MSVKTKSLLQLNMAHKFRVGSQGNRSFDRSALPLNHFLGSKPPMRTQPNDEQELQDVLERFMTNSSPKKDIVAEMHRKSRERDLSAEKMHANTRMLENRRNLKAKGLHLSRKELSSKQNSEKSVTNQLPGTTQTKLSVRYQQLAVDRTDMRRRPASPQPKPPELKAETILDFKKRLATIRPNSTNYSRRYMNQSTETPYLSSELNISQGDVATTSLRQHNLFDLTNVNSIKQSKDFPRPVSKAKAKELIRERETAAEKARLLKSFKKFSEETHDKFTANVKHLARVARGVDVGQQEVYDKISRKKLVSEEEGVAEEAEEDDGATGACYMQINHYFMEEMKKFLNEKVRNGKISETITKSSVQAHLLNMMTLHSSLIQKLMKDDQEDIAAVLLMLMKIHMLEFEDVLVSYKINMDLSSKHKRNGDLDEKRHLHEQIRQQQEKYKSEVANYARSLELVQKRYDRCLKDRQDLERELMDRNAIMYEAERLASKETQP